MPVPAPLSAARLPAITSPLGGGKGAPAAVKPRPQPAATAPSPFPSLLAQQMGLTEPLGGAGAASDPLGALLGSGAGRATPADPLSAALSSPNIAKALAGAQKPASAGAPSARPAGSSPSVGAALSGAAATKAKSAVAWAKSKIGSQDWNALCERFVEEAYGTRGVFPTAKDAAKQLVTHRGSSGLSSAPAGALLYFAPDETNDGAGHAAIYLGNGEMISARPDGVQVERVDTPYNSARYLGWGAPPARFPGRKGATSTRPATGTSGAPAAGGTGATASLDAAQRADSGLTALLGQMGRTSGSTTPRSAALNGAVAPPKLPAARR